MNERVIRRRAVLAAALAAPLVAFGSRESLAADELPLLKESDTTAKAIDYVADGSKVDPRQHAEYRAGRDCSNCQLYYGEKGSDRGACELVLGQLVLAKAWCKAWEQKA